MEKYLITKNELLAFLRYEILYKWKQSSDENFGDYLLKDTVYQPDHEFIQSFCRTKEEKEDPIAAGIYKDILPADVARYQASNLYKPFNGTYEKFY